MKNPKRCQLLIYPEGATSNGIGLLKFKKGAFASLLPVQPYTTDSHSLNLSLAINYCMFVTAHSLPLIPFSDFFGNGKTLKLDIYPVFAPNDYLWEHHQKEGEKKIDTYIRVVREIMLEHSGMEDASQYTDLDRFKFIAAVNGEDIKTMKDQ